MTKGEVRKIRGLLNRPSFAYLLGVDVSTIWRWEEGKATPDGASLTLLMLVKTERKATLALLQRLRNCEVEIIEKVKPD